MKKFIFGLLLLFTTSCVALKQKGYDDVLFSFLKSFTKDNLQKLFPESDFDKKDTLLVKGNFAKTQVQKILGKRIPKFLTPDGRALLETQEFKGDLTWQEYHPDSVTITFDYTNKMQKIKIGIRSFEKTKLLTFDSPTTWNELSKEQIWSIADKLFTEPVHIAKYELLRSIYPKEILSNISAEDAHRLTLGYDNFLNEINLTKNHFKKYKSYHGPADLLEKTTVNEYAKADNLFRSFIKNKKQSDLDAFTACFYRKAPLLHYFNKNSTNYTGDPRKSFNTNNLEANTRHVKHFPQQLKFATLLLFMGTKNQFLKMFPYIFPKKKEKENEKQKAGSWADTKLDLAEANIFGDINSTGEASIITALAFLNKKAKEAKEMEEKLKT